ncbi:sister chromatid cohesion protein PDS5 [Methanobrevibacter sp.]|uniref:sister chromatid cohesion protein PDS5 n=1 Tax=Methanobrevibacter sp. TaxID=66852 RepID=UPI0025E106AF|nr:sister chromatid cohesion protein PDS5 [Methanobrevibacter sp.]MBQ2961807.1 HEAT repeat domain-containing protein [Methanobrevibacter sp.]
MSTNDSENEILKELRDITKDKENWKSRIDFVGEKISGDHSVEVKAKALWILGEMGLRYPLEVEAYIENIIFYLEDDDSKLRERATNAMGRIGRADKNLILPYLDKLMEMREDKSANVRLAFVWACENIGTNAPELFCEKLDLFYEMISDENEKVRIESPEMFRVIGKRKPDCVKPYLKKLEFISENDTHPVVRIHCAGAVRITKKALEESENI